MWKRKGDIQLTRKVNIMNQINQQAIPLSFSESDTPRCFLDRSGVYILNEAAYQQIERVADLLAAIASFSEKGDKRTEQLYNTLLFSSELLSEATANHPL